MADSVGTGSDDLACSPVNWLGLIPVQRVRGGIIGRSPAPGWWCWGPAGVLKTCGRWTYKVLDQDLASAVAECSGQEFGKAAGDFPD